MMKPSISFFFVMLLGCGGAQPTSDPVAESPTEGSPADVENGAAPAEPEAGADQEPEEMSADQAKVEGFVDAIRPGIQACYQTQLVVEPGLAGRIEVEFRFGDDAKVSNVEFLENQIGEDFAACVSGVATGQEIEGAGAGLKVRKTWVFGPE